MVSRMEIVTAKTGENVLHPERGREIKGIEDLTVTALEVTPDRS